MWRKTLWTIKQSLVLFALLGMAHGFKFRVIKGELEGKTKTAEFIPKGYFEGHSEKAAMYGGCSAVLRVIRQTPDEEADEEAYAIKAASPGCERNLEREWAANDRLRKTLTNESVGFSLVIALGTSDDFNIKLPEGQVPYNMGVPVRMLLMKIIDGWDLATDIKQQTGDGTIPLPWSYRCWVASQVLPILEELDKINITHGDLHLGNFIVTRTRQIVVIDFGCSHWPGSDFEGNKIHGTIILISCEVHKEELPRPNQDVQNLVHMLLFRKRMVGSVIPPWQDQCDQLSKLLTARGQYLTLSTEIAKIKEEYQITNIEYYVKVEGTQCPAIPEEMKLELRNMLNNSRMPEAFTGKYHTYAQKFAGLYSNLLKNNQ